MSGCDWKAVYCEAKNTFYLIALTILGDRQLAEDAVHDAFAELIRNSRTAKSPKAYAYQAVRNSALGIASRTREISKLTTRLHPNLDEMVVLEYDESKQQHAQQLAIAALKELSPFEQQVITLHIFAGLKFREISTLLDCPLGTLTSRYHRSMKSLRKTMNTKTWENNNA